MRGRSIGNMGLECDEEVKKKQSFPKISYNINLFIYLKKPINVVTDMEVDEGNLGTQKKSAQSAQNPYYFSH